MDVGSLFFSLGFKSKGTAELQNFETAIDGANSAAEVMQGTFEELLWVIERIALKMGALTEAEIDLHQQDMKLLKTSKDALPVDEKSNKVQEKKNGLLMTAHQKLTQVYGRLNAYRLEVIAGTVALAAFTNKMSDMVIEFDKLSSMTGISADHLQRISAIAAESGASVDDLGSAIKHLQEASVDIMLGKGDISPYAFLGLDPHQDPLKILEQMRIKLQTMPTALGTKAAKDLGLSEELIYFLRHSDQIKPAPEETLLTEAEMKRLKEFNFYFNRVFDQARRVMAKLGAAITPFVTDLLYAFDRLGRMFGSFFTFIEPMNKQVKVLLSVLSAVALAVGAILFPFVKWMAVISLLLVVIEDLYSYFKGDKSVFGGLIDLIKQGVEYIGSLIDKFLGLFSLLKDNPIAKFFIEKLSTLSPATAPAGAGAPGAMGSVINNNNIIVNGAKSPADVAAEVTDKITKTTSDAYYQTAPGGF